MAKRADARIRRVAVVGTGLTRAYIVIDFMGRIIYSYDI
jgi:hypothetical protein